MNTANKLKKLISTKKAKICVIGLGYVGLPIAVEFAKKGFFVYGYDTKKERVQSLKHKKSYIDDIPHQDISLILKKNFSPTSEANVLNESDIIIICVPTPLRKRKFPNISYIIKAAKDIKKYLREGQLIVLESTTYPGTTRDVILPILEKSKLKESVDFFLSFSPERIDPGNKAYPFRKIPKIVGGIAEIDGKLTELLYSKVVNEVHRVSTCESAEVVKILENSFRIVNIGLINEFAMLCDKLKIDVWEVVEAAKTKPFGFTPFYPGPGVGGHCIPADPLYLSWKARKVGFKTEMIDLSAKTNLYMPHYVVHRIEKLLVSNISKSKILVLGVTYKKDVKDLRESPALDIIELLKTKGVKVSYSDPYIPYIELGKIKLKGSAITAKKLKIAI
ncbi:MAG: nucleotide sugar dehydrogenase [Candidatus Omnitrophota bacterium]